MPILFSGSHSPLLVIRMYHSYIETFTCATSGLYYLYRFG